MDLSHGLQQYSTDLRRRKDSLGRVGSQDYVQEDEASDSERSPIPQTETPLYHYTTQRGLLGIISSKEIWVTHTQYLNDRRQFVHAIDLAREEVQRLGATKALTLRMLVF
jgi:hypothetical protein